MHAQPVFLRNVLRNLLYQGLLYPDCVDCGGGHGGDGFDELVGVDRGQLQPGHAHAAPGALAVGPAVLKKL